MTVEKLHDALNLLPSDLITATDQLRTAPRTQIIPWKRMIPLAACFVLLIGMGLVFRREMLLSHMVKQAPAEAPAAMAPVPESQKITMDEAAPEAPAANEPMMEAPAEEGVPELPSDVGALEVPYGEAAGSVSGMEKELFIDHSHTFAEESDRAVNSPAYCGNMQVTVDVAGERFTVSGSDAVVITDILISLDYDPENVCRCMTDITVDTEMLTGIRLDLVQGFARCEKGQAALTETQVQTIHEIIGKLQ